MKKEQNALETVSAKRRDLLKKMLFGGAVVALPLSSAVVSAEDDPTAQGKGKGKGKGGGKGKGKGKGKAKGKGKGRGKGKGSGGGGDE